MSAPRFSVFFVGNELRVVVGDGRRTARPASPSDDASIATAVRAIADELGLNGEQTIELATCAGSAALHVTCPERLLVFQLERPNRGVRISVQAFFDSEHVLRDLVDIRELKARQRLAEDVAARLPALKGRADHVLARLDREVEFFLRMGPVQELPERAGDVEAESPAPSTAQGQEVVFPAPEPWSEPVDGNQVLDDLTALLRQHVVLHGHLAEVVALWIIHAHALDAAEVSPRLILTSPERRCGKSTLLALIGALTPRAILVSHVSVAVLFRMIAAHRPTVILDEGDAYLKHNEDLRAMLNAGHRRDGRVARCVGDSHEVRYFPVFAPTAIAAIGRLPETIQDRAVMVRMKRRAPGEVIQRLVLYRLAHDVDGLVRQIVRWTKDQLPVLKSCDPDVPRELNDRGADNWRPLLAIADAAGPRWAEIARVAARELASEDLKEDEASARIQLLRDVRVIFGERRAQRLGSEELVGALIGMQERPWAEWRGGTGLTQHGMAGLLALFGVRTTTLRLPNGERRKGYRIEDFRDAWLRYLGEAQGVGDDRAGGDTSNRDTVTSQETRGLERHGSASNIRDSVTGGVPPVEGGTDAQRVSQFADWASVTLQPCYGAACHGVTLRADPLSNPPCACKSDHHTWVEWTDPDPGLWSCWSCNFPPAPAAEAGVGP